MLVFNRITEPKQDAVIYNQFKLDEFSKHRLEDMENELRVAKQETQNVIEELETSNEELQASNEELQASNEELQSTNEELQSVNEELYTVNSELQAKNKELNDLTNDFINLFNSTSIAMLFLDKNLRIRKFTPELKKIFKLEENDINRSIENFASNFINITGKDLAKEVSKVIESQKVGYKEIVDDDGNIYLNKIIPFVVNDSKVEGALVTFIDITEITHAKKK
ncbi:MAG: hypothetical protein HC905_05685 [Bacteroidales bacterium]|nr:hypothetical protein [Bacteroidales bacterium]